MEMLSLPAPALIAFNIVEVLCAAPEQNEGILEQLQQKGVK